MVPTGVEFGMVGDRCLIQPFLRQLQNKTQSFYIVVRIKSPAASPLRLSYAVSLPYTERLGMHVQ